MSAAFASPRTGFKFMISISQGADQGTTYQLLPPTVTIGRAPDNNVILTDPKVSRNAARIDFAVETITIHDLSNRSILFVNGEQLTTASIKDGDLIQIGETHFKFVVEALALTPATSHDKMTKLANSPHRNQLASSGTPFHQFQPTRPNPNGSGKSKTTFVVVLLAIGGLLAYLLTSTPVIKNSGQVLRTADAVDKDTKASNDRVVEITKKRSFKNDEEKTRFEEAQKQYLIGFRDYQKGQYMRAMREFETALAIDPDNQLSRRYYKLAEKQRDESVSDLSLEGRRYKDKHMYSRCTAAFEKVLEQIPNKDDTKFKEADALRKECQLLEDERFQ